MKLKYNKRDPLFSFDENASLAPHNPEDGNYRKGRWVYF
jgi:hypothetical protein